jgi:hypothetical protein
MDGFTAASAVVGFIAGLLDIAEVVVQYTRNTLGEKEEKQALLSEIEATNNLLKKLKAKAEGSQWLKTISTSMEESDGPFQRYQSALVTAQKKLEPSKTGADKAVERAVWHFQKGKFAEILDKITRSKADFALLLSVYLDFL